MANHPSAEKRNRQRVVRTERNKAAKSTVRTAVKKARVAIEAGDKAAAMTVVAEAEKALAKAAKKGAVHKKSASRTTSRIRSALSKLS
jgi:small subunit ribosomal protein S20